MRKRSILINILIVICLAVMCFAGYNIYSILSEYRAEETASQQMQQFIDLTPTEPPEAPSAVPETVPEDVTLEGTSIPTEDLVDYPAVDFDSLLAINEEVIGWIYIEGTAVNYPIVQGPDNNKYLNIMADGQVNRSGSIFMDYRSQPDFSDRHTVIYGHYMKNGSMFRDIRKYSDPEFYAAHPTGMIMTPNGNFQFEVIGGYVAKVSDPAWQLDFSSDEDFGAWLDETMSRSTIGGTIVPTAEDSIITLSTCSYEFDNARFVLVCRVMR